MNVSCRSSNLIYCLTCRKCGMQYVGQTKRRLSKRLCEHLKDIDDDNRDRIVARHYNQRDHSGTRDVTVHVLEFVKKAPESEAALKIRLRVEERWIHLLRCPIPSGLNIMKS